MQGDNEVKFQSTMPSICCQCMGSYTYVEVDWLILILYGLVNLQQ